MNKLVKKAIVILLSLTFVLSAAITSSAIMIENQESNVSEQNLINESTSKVKEITVYRFGPDGIINPIQVTIDVDETQDIGRTIVEKCEELFENDIEMKSFLQGNNSSAYILKRVTSYGRGLHIKLSPRIQLNKRIALFPLLPPYLRTAVFLPIRYCKYTRDPGAYTRISALNNRRNISQEYHGPHEILSVGFIGYTGWVGHVSYLGFFIRTGFAGVSAFTKANEI